MTTTINWLLVGTGDIVTKRVADALSTARDSRVVAVCGSSHARVAAIADKVNAPGRFSDLREALKRSEANAVYVARPVYAHSADAIAALAAGKHVLVEKPLALNRRDAQSIVDAAQHAGTVAACAYYRRTFPRFAHARDVLQSGALGRISQVRMAYDGWFNPAPDDPKHWRVEPARSGGGPLADMGSHMVDILIGLFGLPQRIMARADNRVHSYDAEDTAVAVMTYEDGPLVTMTCSWCAKAWQHEFEIIGTEGRLAWSPFDTGPVVTVIGRDSKTIDLPNAANVHTPLVEDFVDAVRARREPVCAVSEAAKTNRVIDALYESARRKAEVAV